MNKAACKLLDYSKKEMLTKLRADIFDISDPAFRKMLKQRAAAGNSTALVTAIKKNGKHVTCEFTSAIFIDADSTKKAVSTIAAISKRLLKQKKIFTINKEILVANISIAQSKQRKIDATKEKIVASNIDLAKSNQKKIDQQNEEIVVANIDLAKSKQKKIDQQNEKKVSADIVIALEKSEARLQENNEWIKYIAKTSYDVMWDWNIVSGEIYVGDSLEEVFRYKVRDNKIQFADFLQCLMLEEKKNIENKLSRTLEAGGKSWDDADRKSVV